MATLTYTIVGNFTPTGVTVTGKFAALATGDAARLAISLVSGMTSPSFGASVTIDADGYAKLPSAALTANTTYFYGVSINGATATQVGTFKTLPVAGSQSSFNFGFASCANADTAALPNLKARNPLFFLHLGDLHYDDITTNSPVQFRTSYDAVLARTNHKPFFRDVPTDYMWSDHDWGGNNSNGSAASGPAAQSVFRQVWPHHPLASTDGQGIYRSFPCGRVKFIMLDCRSYKSAQSATDNSSKTMLGATQKAWLKNEITTTTESLILLCSDVPWIQSATAGEDNWGGYSTERSELVTHMQASGKNIAILAGDMHAVAFDSGTNSPGGFAVFQAAPLHQTASIKGGPYSGGTYPASGAAVVEQYGFMAVTDNGTSVVLDFQGFSADGTQRITGSKTFAVSAPPTPPAANSFTASWNASSGATGYDVEVAIGPEDFILVSSNQPDTTYSYTHPTNGTTHQIRVTPRNGTSVGPSSSNSATATQGAVVTTWRDAVIALGPSLRSYWTIDDATGTTLTAADGPAGSYWGMQQGWLSPVVVDPNRQHRFFDTNAYATVADVPELDLANSFSLLLAIRRGTTGAGTFTVYDKGAGSTGVWFVDDKLTFGAVNSTTAITAETGTTTDRNPHLFLVTWDGTNAKIWKDNVDVTGSVTATTLVDTAVALNLGKYSGGSTNWFSGSMEVGTYTGVLTANQRAALYSAYSGTTVTPPTTPAGPPTGVTLTYNSGTSQLTASWTANAGAVGYFVEEQVGPSAVWRRKNTTATTGTSLSWAAPPDGTLRKTRVFSLAPEGTETAASATASTTVTQGSVNTAFRDAVLALGAQVTYGWTLDEQTATTAMSAAKGTAGTYGAADPARVPAPGWLSPVPSNRNRAHRYFSGDDTAQVTYETGLNLGDGPMTFVVAVCRDISNVSATDYHTIINRQTPTPSIVFSQDKLSFYRSQDSTFITQETGTTPGNNIPALYFVSKNGSTITIHKATQTSSVTDVTGAITNVALGDNTSDLGIGSGLNPLRNFYNGSFELYICPAVLTTAQRQSIVDAWLGVVTPNPPASLTATGSTDASGNITLVWSLVPGAASYNVYRTGTATPIANVAQPGSGTTVTYTDPGRSVGVSQTYTIKTVAGGVESTTSSPSASAAPTAPATTPTLQVSPTSVSLAPSVLTGNFAVVVSTSTSTTPIAFVEDIAITQAMVLADPGSPYTITQAPGAPWLTVLEPTGLTPTTIHVQANPAGLSAAQTYTGSLSVAVAGAVGSPKTVLVTFTTSGVLIPSPTVPGGLGGTEGDSQVIVTWNPNPTGEQIEGYELFRNGVLLSPSTTATSYLVSGLTNDIASSYQVRAFNQTGTSGLSSPISLTPHGSTPAPPPPTGGDPQDLPEGAAVGTVWDLVLCDRNGTALGQILNARGRTLRFSLRGTPTLQFSVSSSHALAPYMLQTDQMLVKAYENSTGDRKLRFIGPITSYERVRESAAGTFSIVATGVRWRLDYRMIGQGLNGATFGTTPIILRDRGDMMGTMIDALNRGDTSAILCEANDTGIRRGSIYESSKTYVGPWLWKVAGTVLTELSSSLDSPDWEIEPVEPLADSLGVQIGRLNVQPVIGLYAPQAAWEYGTGKHNVKTFRDVGDAGSGANRVVAPPPGYPDQTVGEVQVAFDSESQESRGLLEALVDSDLADNNLRKELAEQHILVRKMPRRIISFSPIPEETATESERRVPRLFAEFKIGDFVPFRAIEPIEVLDEEGNIAGYEDRIVVDATFRVYGATVNIDDNGVSMVDLTLVEEA
jgi:hypothetical protein